MTSGARAGVVPSTSRAPGKRPVTITVALVLVYLSGVSNAAVGIFVLLSRYDVEPDAMLPVSLLGAGIILFGLLLLAVASATARGSRLARILLTLWVALLLALHIVTILGTDWDAVLIVQMIAEAYVLAALWTPPGSRYFRRPAPATVPAAP